jgi:hypothetical protein
VGRDTPGTRANTPAYGAVPDHERCRARKTSLEPGASATVITYTAAGRPIARRCNAGYGNKAGFFGAESFSWIVSARSNSGRRPSRWVVEARYRIGIVPPPRHPRGDKPSPIQGTVRSRCKAAALCGGRCTRTNLPSHHRCAGTGRRTTVRASSSGRKRSV